MGRSCLAGIGDLFVALRRITLETINRTGLRQAQRQPVLRPQLQRDKELLAPFHRGGVEFVPALESKPRGRSGELAEWLKAAVC